MDLHTEELSLHAAQIRSMLGKRFTYNGLDAIKVADKRSIQQFALATGDLNPLSLDADYAAKTRSGQLVTSATFLSGIMDSGHVVALSSSFSAAEGLVAFEDPSFQVRIDPRFVPPSMEEDPMYRWIGNARPVFRDVAWEFYRPVRVGDSHFRVGGVLTELTERNSSVYGPTLIVKGEQEYRNGDGDLLARTVASVTTFDQRNSDTDKTADVQGCEPTPERDVVPIADALHRVERRGSQPRYWEDVNVGEAVTPLLKGTFDHSEIYVSYLGLALGMVKLPDDVAALADRKDFLGAALAFRRQARPPLATDRHAVDEFSRKEGVPRAFDVGENRLAWAGQFFTDWMGDDARLTKLRIQFRSYLLVGDTIRLMGKVTGKHRSGTECLVDCEYWFENHLGHRPSIGTAQVALPSRVG